MDPFLASAVRSTEHAMRVPLSTEKDLLEGIYHSNMAIASMLTFIVGRMLEEDE